MARADLLIDIVKAVAEGDWALDPITIGHGIERNHRHLGDVRVASQFCTRTGHLP